MAKKKPVKKKAPPRHHPDYDPEVGCGSLYLQEEVAVQVMLAIAYSLRHNKKLDDIDEQRLCVAATVINDVFGLGIQEVSDVSGIRSKEGQ